MPKHEPVMMFTPLKESWYRGGRAAAIAMIAIVAANLAPADQASDLHIRIDQFGYSPGAQKIAVLRNPMTGYDAPAPYTPGGSIEIRRAADDSVAFTATPVAWNGGATHAQSGDQVWWADFSTLVEAGVFYVHDPSSGVSSETFEIQAEVYNNVLRQAVRMFFYQRCGLSKAVPYADADWADESPCHLGEGQDLDCRLVTNPVPSTARDLSGGWHDAGDYNKYVNYANEAVNTLLDAYEIAPGIWGDDFGLPESGNGVPDVLDELRWELEWLLKMQVEDGAVLHKVSVAGWDGASPPSNDTAARYYAPPTASATASACGMFAHGANVFGSLSDPGTQAFASTLSTAALAAWNWLAANPGYSNYDNAGFSSAAAEYDQYTQEMTRLRAAAHLLKLTGDSAYRDWFDAHYADSHLIAWGYAMSWEDIPQTGLLLYTTLPEATPAVVSDIRTAWAAALGSMLAGEINSQADAYRAHLSDGDYVWGSNRTKCIKGDMLAATVRLGIDPSNAQAYGNAAADFLHYIHGVNPTGFCFLTHMDDFGAAGSLREMYHVWFGDGTDWDNADTSPYGPPPGYLVGGVNPFYSPDPAYQGPPIEPPQNQPIQKSYKDWNAGWPENSWEMTECHIPYQAAYLRLLAGFARRPGDFNNDGHTDGDDFDIFAECMNGPDVATPPPGCDQIQFAVADLEFDADVDLGDFAAFQQAFVNP